MHSELRAQIAFRLTGLRAEGQSPPDPRQLRPALAARLRDLVPLRYDFPVVLVADPADDLFARPLRDVVDQLVAALTAGNAEDAKMRAALLRIEREIRVMLGEAASGKLTDLWDAAAARIAPCIDEESAGHLARARKALQVDGAVIDCDAAFAGRFVRHAWDLQQRRKATRFHEEAERLVAGLTAILDAEDARSPQARSAARLRETFGTVHRDSFDFDAMSKLLQRAPQRRALTDARRRRIRALMTALESQRFFAEGAGYAFEFDRCGAALKAFRARYASLRSLARALVTARLEVSGEYDDTRHGEVLRRVRASALTREELARFPDYLVCVRECDLDAAGRAEIFELLVSGVPARILVQCDDLLQEAAASNGLAAVAAWARALTGSAIGLADVFVAQAAASQLPRMHGEVFAALAHPGTALVNVFSGAGAASALPPYLCSAAAVESRVFPSFTYDPRKAADARYSLEHNPQPERDWPVHAFDYEDSELQRAHRDMGFTSADFIATDVRFARHFQWLHGLARALPVSECLDADVADDAAPVVTMVDDGDLVRELAVEEAILEQTRRCREWWRALQHLARGRAPAVVEAPPAAPDTAPAPAVVAPAAPVAETNPAATPGDPFIETPRCTTCNECTQINNRLFAYDANKQAYIADLAAGTYRQLVEAAESCQVSIIHPGKPRDPGEAGLEELLERAAPFL